MKKLFSFLAAALFAGSMSAGTNDLLWDYTSANIPTTSPDNGLYYDSYVNDAADKNLGLHGVKLNSTGYAYFEKAEVAGTLKLVYSSRKVAEDKYQVDVCAGTRVTTTEGTTITKGDLIATTDAVTSCVEVSVSLDATTKGVYICRKTNTEGVLCKIEFVADPDTVFFVNKDAWETVKIHAWGGTAPGTTWPGLDVQKADYQLQDADVYYFVAEQGAYGKCIFNNANGTQTADLTWTAGKYYYEGSWYTRAELEEPVEEATYFLIGSFNNWKLDTALPMYDDEITVEWAAGAYEFKVVKDRSWAGALGYSDVDAECSDGGYEQNGTNVKVVLAEDGEVTVAVTEEGKLCLKGDFGGTIVVSTWTIVGVEALMGSNWDVNDPANEMTEVDDLWTLTKMHVRLTAGTEYKYKLVGDHSYSVFQYPVEGDQVLTVTEDGKYDVTFTWNEEDDLTAAAVPSITTALENNTRVNASKVLVDGQMLIEVDGVRYNVVGVRF